MKAILLVWSLALLLSSCGKSDDSSPDSSGDGGSGKASNAAAGDNPWDDPAKPYLDDKKMDNFLGSLKDPDGPFKAAQEGKISILNPDGPWKAFDASAKKHGFQGGAEYLGVWMRIVSANTVVMQQENNASMIKMQEESIKAQQDMLKKPEMTAEMKQMSEDSIKASKEAIEALKKSEIEGVNAQDIETFKKHRTQFEEAMKTWK